MAESGGAGKSISGSGEYRPEGPSGTDERHAADHEPDPKSERELAWGLVQGINRGITQNDLRVVAYLGGDAIPFLDLQKGDRFRRELKRIILEESGDIPIIAAYVLLKIDVCDSAAISKVIQALQGDDLCLCGLAAGYMGVLPKVPEKVLPSLQRLLGGDDPGLRLAAAVALRESSHLAMKTLTLALHGEDSLSRIAAAGALGRVAKHLLPEKVSMRQIISTLSAKLEIMGSEEQFAAVFWLGEIGPPAGDAVPGLVSLLKDVTINSGIRSIAVDALGKIGQKKKAVDAISGFVRHSIHAKDWRGVHTAAESLAALGEVPMIVIDDLANLLESGDAECQLVGLHALRTFGPCGQSAIPRLIEFIESDRPIESGAAWAKTMGAIGEAAVEPLVHLVKRGPFGVLCWAGAALVCAGEQGATEAVFRLLTSADRDVRDFLANFLKAVPASANVAVPAIVRLLEAEDGERHLEAAVTALKGLGTGARDAAPIFAQFLGQGTGLSKELAMEGLINIGPECIPPLQRAIQSADPEGKDRIQALLARWNFAMVSGGTGLEHVEERLLRFYAEFGCILRDRGPTSFRIVGDILRMPPTTVRKRLAKLERWKKVRLTDKAGTKKGGLTPEGEQLLNQVLSFLEKNGWRPRKFDA